MFLTSVPTITSALLQLPLSLVQHIVNSADRLPTNNSNSRSNSFQPIYKSMRKIPGHTKKIRAVRKDLNWQAQLSQKHSLNYFTATIKINLKQRTRRVTMIPWSKTKSIMRKRIILLWRGCLSILHGMVQYMALLLFKLRYIVYPW